MCAYCKHVFHAGKLRPAYCARDEIVAYINKESEAAMRDERAVAEVPPRPTASGGKLVVVVFGLIVAVAALVLFALLRR